MNGGRLNRELPRRFTRFNAHRHTTVSRHASVPGDGVDNNQVYAMSTVSRQVYARRRGYARTARRKRPPVGNNGKQRLTAPRPAAGCRYAWLASAVLFGIA